MWMRFNPRDISKNIITGSTVQIFTFNLERDFFLMTSDIINLLRTVNMTMY